jgi:hypothetical protein
MENSLEKPNLGRYEDEAVYLNQGKFGQFVHHIN